MSERLPGQPEPQKPATEASWEQRRHAITEEHARQREVGESTLEQVRVARKSRNRILSSLLITVGTFLTMAATEAQAQTRGSIDRTHHTAEAGTRALAEGLAQTRERLIRSMQLAGQHERQLRDQLEANASAQGLVKIKKGYTREVSYEPGVKTKFEMTVYAPSNSTTEEFRQLASEHNAACGAFVKAMYAWNDGKAMLNLPDLGPADYQ